MAGLTSLARERMEGTVVVEASVAREQKVGLASLVREWLAASAVVTASMGTD